MTRIVYLAGSADRWSVEGSELNMTSTAEAAVHVMSGEIRTERLHGFMAINWRGCNAADCTAPVANIVADLIVARWCDAPEFDAHLRAVTAWVESELTVAWDHGIGQFRDSRALIAALNASRGRALIAAE